MSAKGEVLIAILNKQLDFAIAREQQSYRIPIGSAEKWLGKRWPPKWIAFYHTKVFGSLAFGIHYYARILNIRQAYRWQLFPNEPQGERSNRRYYQLMLEPLRPLPQPILSRRWRRIVFIPTTWDKFTYAAEINDLYDESPLEDRLWAEFKRLKIQAERQEFIRLNDTDYALDFAIYCAKGNIDVETDGDLWHANPERAYVDNLRNNALETMGWSVIRFSTPQIQEELAEYCIPKVLENINRLGGLEEGKLLPRRFDLDQMDVSRQLSLFDEPDQAGANER
jgi:very-short-patch-repair endonuclease